MIFLGVILTLLLIGSIIGTIVGLINPALFKQTNRWKVSALGLGTFFAIFVLLVVVAELDQEEPSQQEIYLNITHQEDAQGILTFAVKTNLPDKSKIVLILYAADNEQIGSARVIIKNGVGNSPKFTDKGKLHQAGQYELNILDSNRQAMQFERIQYKFTKKISSNKKQSAVVKTQVGNLAKDKRFVNTFLESFEAEYEFFLQTVAQLELDAEALLNMSEPRKQKQAERIHENWGMFSASYNRFNKNLLPDDPSIPKELGNWKKRSCNKAIFEVYHQPTLMFFAWGDFNKIVTGRATNYAAYNQAHQAVLKGFKQIRQDLKLCK